MQKNSKTIMMPVEIKKRELIGKILLTLKLVQRDHTVFLGSTDQKTAFDIIKPDVYFALSAVNRQRRRAKLSRLKECDVDIIILDTEGSPWGEVDDFRRRINSNILSHVDYYCAWGPKAAKITSNEHKNLSVQIKETGNPRFDLLQEPFTQFYEVSVDRINEKHQDYILVNTNFTVNHQSIEHNKQSAMTDVTEKYKKQSALIGEFISAICSLSQKFQGYDIIVRPHPSENPSLYRRILFPYDNVYVKQDGTARPWIIASDAVVHNSCTTGVTAALLDTPVFAYLPQSIMFNSIPNEVSQKCYNITDLVQNIDAAVSSGMTHELNKKQKSRVQQYIGNVEYTSIERIANIIDSIDHQRSTGFDRHLQPQMKHRIKRPIVKTLGSDRFGPIYYRYILGGGSVEYKFSKTTLSDIKSIISRFPDSIVPDNINISTVPEVVYTFKFEKS
jgi:surface carbohydrate biosynthesis protein